MCAAVLPLNAQRSSKCFAIPDSTHTHLPALVFVPHFAAPVGVVTTTVATYSGCFAEPVCGDVRALTLLARADDMTVEKCVGLARDKGLRYAGKV